MDMSSPFSIFSENYTKNRTELGRGIDEAARRVEDNGTTDSVFPAARVKEESSLYYSLPNLFFSASSIATNSGGQSSGLSTSTINGKTE